MPGAYAHMTLVNALREPARADPAGVPAGALYAVGKYLKFCELGAVSPDYPYLALGDGKANRWADVMHYQRTGDMINAGVRLVRNMTGPAATKGLAWLLGFAAHVATDVSIHPVIELKVGPYAQNKTRHRLCEMSQDVYIYGRFRAGHIDETQHLKSGIGACGASGDTNRLDRDIAALWSAMLHEVHSAEAESNPPDLDKWHGSFQLVIGKVAAGGRNLVPFARHLLDGEALTYPEKPDENYLKNLATPDGRRLHYDDIFNLAVENVGRVWADVANGVLGATGRDNVASVRNWNLDTGRSEDGEIGFWGVA